MEPQTHAPRKTRPADRDKSYTAWTRPPQVDARPELDWPCPIQPEGECVREELCHSCSLAALCGRP